MLPDRVFIGPNKLEKNELPHGVVTTTAAISFSRWSLTWMTCWWRTPTHGGILDYGSVVDSASRPSRNSKRRLLDEFLSHLESRNHSTPEGPLKLPLFCAIDISWADTSDVILERCRRIYDEKAYIPYAFFPKRVPPHSKPLSELRDASVLSRGDHFIDRWHPHWETPYVTFDLDFFYQRLRNSAAASEFTHFSGRNDAGWVPFIDPQVLTLSFAVAEVDIRGGVITKAKTETRCGAAVESVHDEYRKTIDRCRQIVDSRLAELDAFSFVLSRSHLLKEAVETAGSGTQAFYERCRQLQQREAHRAAFGTDPIPPEPAG